LDRRLGGPQSRSGRGGEEKNIQIDAATIKKICKQYLLEKLKQRDQLGDLGL
jgi:hypothetical protein